MSSMDVDNNEGSFQTPASKKRKASDSSPLPPSRNPTPITTYTNRIPIIVQGIDPKFNSPLLVLSELIQYHPGIRVSKIEQTKTGWFLKGIHPKIFPLCRESRKGNKCSAKMLRRYCQRPTTL